MFGLGPTARLVNRVVDKNGDRVPQEYMISGEGLWVRDTLDVPVGVARILIHQSMYKIDPVTHQPSYKLGCTSLGVETTDVPLDEIERIELVDRDLLPDKKRKYQTIHNPINPAMSRGTLPPKGNSDGVHPGEFGWRE